MDNDKLGWTEEWNLLQFHAHSRQGVKILCSIVFSRDMLVIHISLDIQKLCERISEIKNLLQIPRWKKTQLASFRRVPWPCIFTHSNLNETFIVITCQWCAVTSQNLHKWSLSSAFLSHMPSSEKDRFPCNCQSHSLAVHLDSHTVKQLQHYFKVPPPCTQKCVQGKLVSSQQVLQNILVQLSVPWVALFREETKNKLCSTRQHPWSLWEDINTHSHMHTLKLLVQPGFLKHYVPFVQPIWTHNESDITATKQ